jgi:hypothetical protein
MRLTSNGGMFFQQLAGGFRKSEGGLFAEAADMGRSKPLVRTAVAIW